MDPRPARFLFPVALLLVPAWWQTRAFRVNIRADSYLGPILPGLRAEGHTRGFGLGLFTSGRAISPSGGSKGAAPGADMTIDLLVGATKPGFSMWKARTLMVNIASKLHCELEITPNLITDQSIAN